MRGRIHPLIGKRGAGSRLRSQPLANFENLVSRIDLFSGGPEFTDAIEMLCQQRELLCARPSANRLARLWLRASLIEHLPAFLRQLAAVGLFDLRRTLYTDSLRADLSAGQNARGLTAFAYDLRLLCEASVSDEFPTAADVLGELDEVVSVLFADSRWQPHDAYDLSIQLNGVLLNELRRLWAFTGVASTRWWAEDPCAVVLGRDYNRLKSEAIFYDGRSSDFKLTYYLDTDRWEAMIRAAQACGYAASVETMRDAAADALKRTVIEFIM
jgi:hypothetical protein